MKNINTKSRKGFTLIELLVVIGILAVLAAIAIPSVAGLIDRANVSADNTNCNEMTNAMERFVSEYELYCQDIANGTLDINNLDSAQGRVYNVTGVKTRADITAIESYSGLNGKHIDKDTKYPQNLTTAKSIIENYTKTSSSTFEPKQSDMSYWYNVPTGFVICAEEEIEFSELYDKLPTNINAQSYAPSTTDWINLTEGVEKLPIEFLGFKRMNQYNVYIYFRLPKNVENLENYGLITEIEDTDVLNIDNYYAEFNFSKLKNDEHNHIHFETNEYKVIQITLGLPENFNCKFRTYFKYEIDGKTKYSYSPIIDAIGEDISYDEILDFNK